MTRDRVLFLVISLSVLVPIVTGGISRAVATDEDASEDSLFKSLSVFTEVLQLVRRSYVDEKPLDELMLGALEGTTNALGPFSTYVPASDAEAFERVRQVGDRLSGLTVGRERGILYVAAVATSSPAETAGVLPGDIISRVAGEPTQSTPLWQVTSMLASKAGEVVDLGLVRRGQEMDVELELGSFEQQLPAIESVEDQPMIVVRSFSDQSVARFSELLSEVEGEHLLVDLRGASGSEFENAYAMADLFAAGDLGALISKTESVKTFRAEKGLLWRGRTVVLVNQAAFGPAEILAAVLQQAADAKIVGQKTFGYAGRQVVEKLSSGDIVQLTDAFYAGPDGEKLLDGVAPDFEPDYEDFGFDDAEKPLDELILERGLEVLLGDDVELEKAA